MSPEVPVTIRCHPNLWDHWRERLRRPATLESHVSDVGCSNPPGIARRSMAKPRSSRPPGCTRSNGAGRRGGGEAPRRGDGGRPVRHPPACRSVAARRAGVPGFLLANFTWVDIYAPHARQSGRALRLVTELRRAYRHADGAVRDRAALRMGDFAPVIEFGMVVTPGTDRREELRKRARLGRDRKARLSLRRAVRPGQPGLGRLAKLKGRGLHFVGFHPAPSGRLTNLHVVQAPTGRGPS